MTKHFEWLTTHKIIDSLLNKLTFETMTEDLIKKCIADVMNIKEQNDKKDIILLETMNYLDELNLAIIESGFEIKKINEDKVIN